MKLATYLQLVPRLRINGAIPLHDLMACAVTTLLFVLCFVSIAILVSSFDGSVRVVTSVDRTETRGDAYGYAFLTQTRKFLERQF